MVISAPLRDMSSYSRVAKKASITPSPAFQHAHLTLSGFRKTNKVLTQTSCPYVPGHKEESGLDRLVGQIKDDLDTTVPLQDKGNASRRTGDI
ncbi:hypothetical protein Pcinc_005286 [Petrolisthes cinctipes]|uniref:Uncharacterized protein n=1 Tax=Petrolisthes cinctipes TaxID=88211 RepID=A0AAE1GCY0_PETCI|nr:hypothetical protein Pcinc_005286 [Petrolisthes cinctipes]